MYRLATVDIYYFSLERKLFFKFPNLFYPVLETDFKNIHLWITKTHPWVKLRPQSLIQLPLFNIPTFSSKLPDSSVPYIMSQ